MIPTRQATTNDIPTLVHHRRAMFMEMGHTDEAQLAEMEAAYAPFLEQTMTTGTMLAWIAEDTNRNPLAGGCLYLYPFPPRPGDTTMRWAYILSMYTEPPARRQGLARRIVENMIAWCREHGVKTISLHASAMGRPIYTALGFTPTTEMRLHLSDHGHP